MEPVKPGYKTTEFWLTLGTFCVCGFVLMGFSPMTNKDSLQNTVTTTIQALSMIISQTAVIIKYLDSRHALKTDKRENE